MQRDSVASERVAQAVARLQLLVGRFPGEAYYVRAAFRALLDREPDGAALGHYRSLLERRAASRADVWNDILASDEYRRRVQPHLEAGQAPAWLDRLLWLRVAREEAALAREGLPPAERFVHAAYRTLLRRIPDEKGLSTLRDALAGGHMTRGDVFAFLRRSDEFASQQGLRLYPQTRVRLVGAVIATYLRQSAPRPLPLDARAWLGAVYRVLLDRELDDAGARRYLPGLERGELRPLEVIDIIMDSNELKRRLGLPISPLHAVHEARMLLFQSHLPPAEVVVDLGGAAHNDPRGALLAMGYAHRPREITILDLPPDDRIGGVAAAEPVQRLTTEEGTVVRYLYRSMADLDPIPDSSVDLVVSGQSIEHISEADAERVCDQAFRILRPGGYFCLDTPNGLLTRIESPDELIHPEHQKEYRPDEIRAMLEQRGFQIVEALGLCPMPETLRSGVFSFAEMTRNVGLTDNPDEGYIFFFKALRP